MEDFVYIILIVIWLLVSFLKRKPKEDRKTSQPASRPEPSSGDQKEVTVEDMLEEFFGTDTKSKERKQVEPVFDASERKRDDDYERLEDRREKELLEQRDDTPMWGQEDSKKKKDPRIQEHEGKSAVSKDFEFTSEKKQQTIDELIASHKREEALRAAQEEVDDEAGIGLEGIPDFDLRNAVIFSEILNRKYD